MADKTQLSMELWWRYQYLRDNGHLRYVDKAKKCDDFFRGVQWSREDMDLLAEQRRPALTINKILSTLNRFPPAPRSACAPAGERPAKRLPKH